MNAVAPLPNLAGVLGGVAGLALAGTIAAVLAFVSAALVLARVAASKDEIFGPKQ